MVTELPRASLSSRKARCSRTCVEMERLGERFNDRNSPSAAVVDRSSDSEDSISAASTIVLAHGCALVCRRRNGGYEAVMAEAARLSELLAQRHHAGDRRLVHELNSAGTKQHGEVIERNDLPLQSDAIGEIDRNSDTLPLKHS
jgi:hypothetical protein